MTDYRHTQLLKAARQRSRSRDDVAFDSTPLAEDELVCLPASRQPISVKIAPPIAASRPSAATNSAWYVIGGVVALLLAVSWYAFGEFANHSQTGPQPLAKVDSVSPLPSISPRQTSPKLAAHSPSTKKQHSPGKGPLAQGKHPTAPVWKDPLDARIAKASTKVHRKLSAVATVYDSSLDRLDRKLEKMARELSRGTL